MVLAEYADSESKVEERILRDFQELRERRFWFLGDRF